MSSGSSLMRLFLFLFLCFSASLAEAATDNTPAWRDAMTAYKAGDYQVALERFKKISEDEKQISAALCHNIANCEYKLDNETAASIWYRRAVALDPWLPEAGQNLRFLHRKKGFLRFEHGGHAGTSGFVRDELVTLALLAPRRYWITACKGAVWGTVILTVWLVWVTPRPGRRWPLVTLLCLTSAFLVVTLCALAGKALDDAPPLSKRLISLPDDAVARSAPAEAAGTVITVPGGSELLPIKEEGFWTYCDLPGGDEHAPLRGWVRTSTTERLWPWDPSLVE